MASDDALVSVLIGAVATVVLTPFVPFAPLLGGAIAGYMRGGSRGDGIRVGAYAGAVALLPVVFLVFAFGNLFFALAGGFPPGVPMAAGGFTIVVLVFALVSAFVYTVAFSAAGGWIGNYVKYDTDIDI